MYTPKPLRWDDVLSTGEETIDSQHKYLVETLNELGDAINSGHALEIISRILGRLRFYAGWHFEREEECFDTYHCPAAEKKIIKLIRSSLLNLTNTILNFAKMVETSRWR